MYLFSSGTVSVQAILSPTLNFNDSQGLRYAVAFDNEQPQIMNMHAQAQHNNWQAWVSNNAITVTSTHVLAFPGMHILKFWMVDPGVVLQKLVVDAGGVKPSYLGPPESYFIGSGTAQGAPRAQRYYTDEFNQQQ
jgi:hypothetical protein